MIDPSHQICGWEPYGLLPENKESKVKRLVHSLREELSLVRQTKSPLHLQVALSHARELLKMNFLPQIVDRGKMVSAHNSLFPKEWEIGHQAFDSPSPNHSTEEWLKYQEILRSFEQLSEVSQRQLLRELRIARRK